MKKLYSLLLVFLLSFGASAQVFATLGAEWHYTNLESGWMPNRGYEKVTAVGDTVIQGKVCRKLERTLVTTYSSTVQSLPDEFLHINGDTVFLLQADSLFHVLYNFAAQPGDSWIILGRTSWGDPTLGDVVVTVDSISVTSINGHQLRQLHVSTTTPLTSFGHPSTITEKLGGANYMFPVDYGFSDSFIRIGLRCYSDPNFGNYQSNPSIGCTQLITTSAPENNPLFPQKTYPNPTAGLVKIEFPAEIRQPKTLRIFDALGRLVQRHQIAAEQNAVQVTLPAKGLYLFLTEIQGQTVFSQKIIRE